MSALINLCTLFACLQIDSLREAGWARRVSRWNLAGTDPGQRELPVVSITHRVYSAFVFTCMSLFLSVCDCRYPESTKGGGDLRSPGVVSLLVQVFEIKHG